VIGPLGIEQIGQASVPVSFPERRKSRLWAKMGLDKFAKL
jgi:hypothetical protein